MNKNILKQAQQMQAKLAKAQEELGKATVEASSGGGAVTVVVTGHQQLLSVKIQPDAVDADDIEMLEDLVLAAVNEGMDKARELASKQLGEITGGLNIPGLF
ncbi:MAG: YbaB/EbfC family nucleoid-associated protein [Dehalococcoidia bacterium]|nr:MAG: YbaB/EbfC family nucleoid-associated protein [Dehalococcoidia bacterium]